MCFRHNFHSELLAHHLFVQAEHVRRLRKSHRAEDVDTPMALHACEHASYGSHLSIGCLVQSQPLASHTDQSRYLPLDITNVVDAGCEWIVDVDAEHLPISFTIINHSQAAKHLCVRYGAHAVS